MCTFAMNTNCKNIGLRFGSGCFINVVMDFGSNNFKRFRSETGLSRFQSLVYIIFVLIYLLICLSYSTCSTYKK